MTSNQRQSPRQSYGFPTCCPEKRTSSRCSDGCKKSPPLCLRGGLTTTRLKVSLVDGAQVLGVCAAFLALGGVGLGVGGAIVSVALFVAGVSGSAAYGNALKAKLYARALRTIVPSVEGAQGGRSPMAMPRLEAPQPPEPLLEPQPKLQFLEVCVRR